MLANSLKFSATVFFMAMPKPEFLIGIARNLPATKWTVAKFCLGQFHFFSSLDKTVFSALERQNDIAVSRETITFSYPAFIQYIPKFAL